VSCRTPSPLLVVSAWPARSSLPVGSAWPLGVGGDGGDGLLGVLALGLAVGLRGGGAVVLRLLAIVGCGGGRCAGQRAFPYEPQFSGIAVSIDPVT
jgi:hypothetical protein